jgi:protein TonB
MLRKKNFNQEFLDILFQQRNKVYGAYELRINYSRRMKKAFSIMGLVFGLAACLPFLSVSSNSVDPKVRKPTVLTTIQINQKVLPQTPPKKRSEVAKTTRTKTTTKALSYKIDKTEKLILQPSLPDKEEFISKVPGTTTPTGEPNPSGDGGITGGKGAQPQAPTVLPKVEDFVYNPEDFSGELPLFSRRRRCVKPFYYRSIQHTPHRLYAKI